MSESIIQFHKQCLVCGSYGKLEKHHVLFGTPRRKYADEDGLWVWLCPEHHRGTYGVHGKEGHDLDLTLKRVAQRAYEETHTREEWLKRYRRNYLDE